jgi:hypothetical protein
LRLLSLSSCLTSRRGGHVRRASICYDQAYPRRPGPLSYDVREAKVPLSLDMTWRGGPGSTIPIYCNHWLPRWWRWDDSLQDIAHRYDAFIGVSLVFVLLLIRDATVKGKSEHRGRDAHAEPIDAICWHSADDRRIKSVVYCPATLTSLPPTSPQPAQILAAWASCVRSHTVA